MTIVNCCSDVVQLKINYLKFFTKVRYDAGSTPAASTSLRSEKRMLFRTSPWQAIDKANPEEKTDDLDSRLKAHNNGQVPHTAKYRPWRIETAIAFSCRKKAADFEKYLKSHSGRAFAKKRL